MRCVFPITQRVVLWQGSKVLLLCYDDGKWDVPGGHLEQEEHPVASICREVWEETGLRIAHPSLLSVERHKHKVMVWYHQEVEGAKVRLSDEHVDFAWVDLDFVWLYPLSRPTIVQALHHAKHQREG